jgi:hypothetical protein
LAERRYPLTAWKNTALHSISVRLDNYVAQAHIIAFVVKMHQQKENVASVLTAIASFFLSAEHAKDSLCLILKGTCKRSCVKSFYVHKNATISLGEGIQ